MKKKLFAAVLCILLFAMLAMAADWTKGSGAKSASAAISTKSGILRQIIVTSASTNAITVDLYDNPSTGSGTKLIPTWVIPAQATAGGVQTLSIADERFGSGLYAAVTGSGGFSYVVIYREDN
jgi:hypothetical protein